MLGRLPRIPPRARAQALDWMFTTDLLRLPDEDRVAGAARDIRSLTLPRVAP